MWQIMALYFLLSYLFKYLDLDLHLRWLVHCSSRKKSPNPLISSLFLLVTVRQIAELLRNFSDLYAICCALPQDRSQMQHSLLTGALLLTGTCPSEDEKRTRFSFIDMNILYSGFCI